MSKAYPQRPERPVKVCPLCISVSSAKATHCPCKPAMIVYVKEAGADEESHFLRFYNNLQRSVRPGLAMKIHPGIDARKKAKTC